MGRRAGGSRPNTYGAPFFSLMLVPVGMPPR
jgi:hypothetical protein